MGSFFAAWVESVTGIHHITKWTSFRSLKRLKTIKVTCFSLLEEPVPNHFSAQQKILHYLEIARDPSALSSEVECSCHCLPRLSQLWLRPTWPVKPPPSWNVGWSLQKSQLSLPWSQWQTKEQRGFRPRRRDSPVSGAASPGSLVSGKAPAPWQGGAPVPVLDPKLWFCLHLSFEFWEHVSTARSCYQKKKHYGCWRLANRKSN